MQTITDSFKVVMSRIVAVDHETLDIGGNVLAEAADVQPVIVFVSVVEADTDEGFLIQTQLSASLNAQASNGFLVDFCRAHGVQYPHSVVDEARQSTIWQQTPVCKHSHKGALKMPRHIQHT